MITSLNIKNVATFDATNGVQINDLKKVNFFFGFNGSGKSTIAKYLRNLSLDATRQNPIFDQCSNAGYDSSQHQILTHNEEFIEENFKRSNEFKGVFSLNQSNAKIDQQITDKETDIESYVSLREKYENLNEIIEKDKKSKSEAVLNYCWDQRTTFATFQKITLAHSGSKPNHLNKIRGILQNPIGQVLGLQELTEQYQTLYERELNEISENVDIKTYHQIRQLEVKLQKLLHEVIVGNEDIDIAGLINTLESRSWIEQGVKFLEETGNTCPFCQNETIDSALREQFDMLFDETYKNKISEIEDLRESYRQKSTTFIESISTIQNVFNPDNIVSNLVIALTALFDANIEIIDYKISHSNERKSIVSLLSKKKDLSDLISRIKTNNQLFIDLDSNKNIFINELWKYLANSCRQQIQNFDNRTIKYSRITTLSNLLKARYEGKIVSARQDIETLRSQTVNTKDAVDNINLILKNSGFEGFEIDEKEVVNNISRYYLKRPHSTSTDPVFTTLSEGEKKGV